MILGQLMGGLGNQLFQIFTTIAYSMKHNHKFIFPYSKKLGERNTYWDNFLLTLYSFTSANSKNQISPETMKRCIVYKEPNFHYNQIPAFDSSEIVALSGYFQSYKYFENERDTICNMMRMESGLTSTRYEFTKYLDFDGEIICMHFRLGDYVNLPLYHPIMQYQYYESALAYIVSVSQQSGASQSVSVGERLNSVAFGTEAKEFDNSVKMRVLYFCEETDNEIVYETIQKLKQKFENIEFVKVDDTIIDWKQMLIMSCCNHNIIANSSFSWWGAYFNQHADKIVCYPSKWFGQNLSKNDTSDMCPEIWHKIDC
jgi:hypothetical protein